MYKWEKRRKETGDFQSKKLENRCYNHKIHDRDAFTEFVKKYGGKTQSEVAKFWGNISRQTIHRALKNWIDTQKKKTYGYEKRSEEKRAEFLKIISAESPKDLLYIMHPFV